MLLSDAAGRARRRAWPDLGLAEIGGETRASTDARPRVRWLEVEKACAAEDARLDLDDVAVCGQHQPAVVDAGSRGRMRSHARSAGLLRGPPGGSGGITQGGPSPRKLFRGGNGLSPPILSPCSSASQACRHG